MSDATFRIVITIFAVMAALSMAAQAFFAFGTFRMLQQLRARMDLLSERMEPVVDSAKQILSDTRPRIEELTRTAAEMAEIVKGQVNRYDQLLTETAERARAQVDRLDLTITDTVDRVQETTSAVQRSILRPVREVNGVMNGVRAAISTLAGGKRPTVEQVTQDEEMFI